MSAVVVTGGASGLGRAVAEKLARDGHHVTITARDPAAGRAASEAISRAAGGAKVSMVELDLASFASVRAAGATLLARGPIDVLLHNAGVMQQSLTRRMTADGVEETLQVNAVSPFLLTVLVLPRLEDAPAGRVVFVSSRLHLPGSRGAPVHYDFEDPSLERDYSPDRAYKNSKLAMLWVAFELARRLGGGPVTSNGVCPGFVPATAAHLTRGWTRFLMRHVLVHMPFATSVEAATDSLAFMAVDPSLAGVSGKFFGEKKVIDSSPESVDPTRAQRFWRWAEQLTGAAGAGR